MTSATKATFWDIEKERTWRIYILFGFLILLYFTSVFFIFTIIKFLLYIRLSLEQSITQFRIFGTDTIYVLIIAAVASIIHWYYSNHNVVTKILKLLGAKHSDTYDKYHHIFQNVVDEIETAAGGLKVERYILPTGAMNAFALADINGRKAIGVTEGLLSRLKRDELQAVVAHEMAHIVSNDCLETTVTCSLFSMYSEALAQLTKILPKSSQHASPLFEKENHKDAFAIGVLSIPFFIGLFVMEIFSHLLNMFISREKEYRADASATKLTRNPLSLASALYRIGTHWRGSGSMGEYLTPIFILSPKFSALDEQEHLWATLFSTHPPLIKRLQILLDLAHTDLNHIAEQIQKKRSIKIEQETIKASAQFYAEHNKRWLGPYTLLQLLTFDWLKPNTRLRMTGENETVNAAEIPYLKHFFQIQSEPIWRIRRLCPTCRQWLIPQEYEGLYIWRCAFCNGVLAERDKLPRIFVRKEKGFTESVQRLAVLIHKESKKKHPRFNIMLDTLKPRSCPKCGKPMTHKFYSYAYHVEIDECQQCGAIWFDENEMELLQCLIEIEEDKS